MRPIFVALFVLYAAFTFGAADLELQSLRALPGADFRIEFRIINHGPDAAQNLGCNIYYYANDQLALTEAVKLPALTAGATRTEQIRLQLPTRTITTLRLEIFDSVEPDVQPSTNSIQLNLKAPALRKADIQVLDVQRHEEKGAGFYQVHLRNNGPAVVLPSRLSVELEVFGEVIATNAKRINRVNPAEEIETRIEIPNAPVVPANDGVLNVRWDVPEIEDPEPTNNVYKLPVALTIRMPDLLPVKPSIDKNGVLTFTISNKGNARAGASVTALYVNGALVQRYNTPEIPPRGTFQYRYKERKLSADDKVAIVADFNADIEESSEENNRLD